MKEGLYMLTAIFSKYRKSKKPRTASDETHAKYRQVFAIYGYVRGQNMKD